MDQQIRSPRYPFVATASVTDERTGSLIIARLGDLSLHGCYIQMTAPLPKGTAITLQVGAGGNVFRAEGKVVNLQPNRGVGVEFGTIDPQSRAVLEAWLLEARAMYASEGAE